MLGSGQRQPKTEIIVTVVRVVVVAVVGTHVVRIIIEAGAATINL